MKKQIYLDNTHEYNLDVQDNLYTLYYSEESQWQSNIKNTIALQIEDDGNGFKIVEGVTRNKKRIDYDEASYLYVIFREIYKEYNYEIGIKEKF